MLSQIIRFFYSHPCTACGRLDSFSNRIGICIHCIRSRRTIQNSKTFPPGCSVCSSHLEEDGNCEYCNSRFVFFSALFSLRSRMSWERQIFQTCKFRNEKILQNYFALDFRKEKFIKIEDKPDCIVFLPSEDRERGRFFHPARHLGERLSRKWKVPILPGVKKVSKDKQSGKMFQERFFHAKKAFVFSKSDRIWKGFHILIIDDIFTTGASLNEVSKMYIAAGARKVSCMVLLNKEGD